MAATVKFKDVPIGAQFLYKRDRNRPGRPAVMVKTSTERAKPVRGVKVERLAKMADVTLIAD